MPVTTHTSDPALHALASKLYLERTGHVYEAHFTHYNHRLRTTGGRFCVLSQGRVGIEMNPRLRGPEALEAVLLHELAHYHLYRLGLPFGHTAAFYELARAWGFPRHVPPQWLPRTGSQHVYTCPRCGREFLFLRKPSRPRSCGACGQGRWNPALRLVYLGRRQGEGALG